MKKLALLFFTLLMSVSYSQQVIGSFPTMDGGFENYTSGNCPTSGSSVANGVQYTDWTNANAASSSVMYQNSQSRTGSKSLNFYFTVTGDRYVRTLTASNTLIVNATAYTFQFYYRTAGTIAPGGALSFSVSSDGTGKGGSYVTFTPSATNGVWTLLTGSANTGTSSTSPRFGIGIIRNTGTAMTAAIDIDDFCIYSGSAADGIAPDVATSPSASPINSTSMGVSWIAPVTGLDGGGYMVVRGTSDPSTPPNVNGIYAVGNSVGTSGTVVYLGTETSFTDFGLTIGKKYYYRIYTVDKAFNYSSAVVTNGVVAPVVISEIYGGGGLSGSYYANDFIVLYNETSSSIDLSNWSVQYADATGSSWTLTPLTGTIAANSYYIIKEGSGGSGADLPTSVLTGTIDLDATTGKVALVNDQNAITGLADANVIDFVGYGSSASEYEVGRAPSPSITNAIMRLNEGTINTGNNSADFVQITPQFSASYAPLPVELSTFTSNMNGRTIQLNWETKTEKNSNKFEIQRSLTSDNNWVSIGSVKAADLSNSPKQYSFTDNNLQAGKFQYRLKMIDNDGTFEYSKVTGAEVTLPKNFDLSQNYPNPFNPSTKISYSLPFDSKITLEVYNIIGEKVAQLVNQEQAAGYYSVDFNKSLSSGIYLYRIHAVDNSTGKDFSSIKKMILMK